MTLSTPHEANVTAIHKIVEQIEYYVIKYGIELVIIEDKAFQKGLKTDKELNRLAGLYGFKVVGHNTGSEKHDPILGVAKMPPTFAAGQVSIPQGDEFSIDMYEPFVSELNRWRPDVPVKQLIQDTVMSFWFLWHRITTERRIAAQQKEQQEQHQQAVARSTRRAGLPWRPTQHRALSRHHRRTR